MNRFNKNVKIVEKGYCYTKMEKEVTKLFENLKKKELPMILDEKIRKYAEIKNFHNLRGRFFLKCGITSALVAFVLIFAFTYFPFIANDKKKETNIVRSEFDIINFNVELTAIDIELEMIKSDVNNVAYLSKVSPFLLGSNK